MVVAAFGVCDKMIARRAGMTMRAKDYHNGQLALPDMVVEKYLEYLMKLTGHEIIDSSELPYPKDRVLDSLLYVIRNTRSVELCELLTSNITTLAKFQDGVGQIPIRLPGAGVDIAGLDDDELIKHATALGAEPMRRFGPLMVADGVLFEDLAQRAKSANSLFEVTGWRWIFGSLKAAIYAPFKK